MSELIAVTSQAPVTTSITATPTVHSLFRFSEHSAEILLVLEVFYQTSTSRYIIIQYD